MEHISKPIIIIGSGRSGTTIISEIIFRHESLAWPSNYQEKFPSAPEINLLRNYFDNKLWRVHGQKPQLNKVSSFNKFLFKPAEAYNFWEYLTGPRIDFSRGFLIHDRANTDEAKKIRSAFRKLVMYQFKRRLAFKITGPSRIGYLQSIFPDAVFINIVRDPLPTINSWLNVDFWQDKGKNQLWWKGAYTLAEEAWAIKNSDKPELLAALQYKKLMDVTAMEIEQHNAKCLAVRYEAFVANPSTVIHTILDFAGLTQSPCVDKYLQRNKIYNQNREIEKNNHRSNKYESSHLEMILNGEYTYAEIG
jgi:omega-hydroxy-beta-dihydromenaquinone-9 sulfotransferase